eukprot:363747-Chlamydomonas_euryale.AAC.19
MDRCHLGKPVVHQLLKASLDTHRGTRCTSTLHHVRILKISPWWPSQCGVTKPVSSLPPSCHRYDGAHTVRRRALMHPTQCRPADRVCHAYLRPGLRLRLLEL